ncbi:MAG: methylmalonyl-CoA mutase family protein, partial [Bacteroidota bacterium]
MKPDFQKYRFETVHIRPEQAQASAEESTVQSAVYGLSNLDGLDHLDAVAGLPPYLRGPYASMYVGKPWTIRQYAGFSTAAESNAFYRKNL